MRRLKASLWSRTRAGTRSNTPVSPRLHRDASRGTISQHSSVVGWLVCCTPDHLGAQQIGPERKVTDAAILETHALWQAGARHSGVQQAHEKHHRRVFFGPRQQSAPLRAGTRTTFTTYPLPVLYTLTPVFAEFGCAFLPPSQCSRRNYRTSAHRYSTTQLTNDADYLFSTILCLSLIHI